MVTQERLKEMLAYDEHSGNFYWRLAIKKVKAGDLAGCITSKKYWRIKLDGREYPAHRLVWLYVYGYLPDGLEVDHKDRCKTNNRILNLRLATRSQNQNNIPARRGSSTGFKGVTLHKETGKFQSAIKINGVNKYLGLFDSPEIAHRAYATEAAKAHGEFLCGVAA